MKCIDWIESQEKICEGCQIKQLSKNEIEKILKIDWLAYRGSSPPSRCYIPGIYPPIKRRS